MASRVIIDEALLVPSRVRSESRPVVTDDLVLATKNEVPAAAEALWTAQARRLTSAAIALGVRVEEAGDVVQDSLLYAFKNLGRFDQARSSFDAWIHGILVSRTSNWHRARRRFRAALWRWSREQLIAAATRPDETLAAEEAKATLERLTARLTPTQRHVWALIEASGLSIRETAAVLKLREETVRSHLRHARLALRRAAKEGP